MRRDNGKEQAFMWRFWLIMAAGHGFISVAAGAFGAHALKERLGAHATTFETGARYEMYHALALVAVAWLSSRAPSAVVNASGWCFFVGTILFSFSLYALSMSGVKWLGAITPLGGLGMLAGWFLLAAAAWRSGGAGV